MHPQGLGERQLHFPNLGRDRPIFLQFSSHDVSKQRDAEEALRALRDRYGQPGDTTQAV